MINLIIQVKNNATQLTRSILEKDLLSEFNNFSWMSRCHRAESNLASRVENKPRGTSMANFSTNPDVNTLFTTTKNAERMSNAAMAEMLGNYTLL